MAKHSICAVTICLFFLQVVCYEKTLRKIVRNQSKMVQRPFSDTGGSESLMWSNSSGNQQLREAVMMPGFTQINAMIHKMRRPKMSTMLSSVETSRGKSAYNKIKSSTSNANELRLTRNTFSNITNVAPSQPFMIKVPGDPRDNVLQLNNHPHNIAIDTYYAVPALSKFFPPLDEQELQGIESKTNSRENTIIFPEIPEPRENKTLLVKSLYLSNKNNSEKFDKTQTKNTLVDIDADSDKVDYFLQGTPVDAGSMYIYNSSVNPYRCLVVKERKADIDAQQLFATLDIEPTWVNQKHFWNAIYDSRYESLMRSPKWPALKVILVPLTHVDSIWKKTFYQYHNDSVNKILSNVVKKLQFYSNLTFTWNEVSHLSQWWKTTSQKSRTAFRKLLKSGRLEITTGGWVEPDEATTHLFGLVHQLIQGHEWLKHHLNYTPKVGWLTNSVTHSPTMSYLLSASDITRLVLTNLHYSWEEYLAEYQHGDFIWVQNWDNDKSAIPNDLNEALNLLGRERQPKNAVFTHYLQFNSASFKACGPNSAVCTNDYNFAKSSKNLDVNSYNVKEKSELLLEQYSKTGTITPHNVIIAPLGGPYRYEFQPEFDYQYNNYQKIADFVNANRQIYKATIEFGTPKDYFRTILTKHKKYPSLKGDFLNYADIDAGCPAYWTGFFTSRPFFKIMLRRLESTLRTTEILFSFALSFNSFRGYNASRIFDDLVKARETYARLLDRNVASGTLPANVVRHVHDLILATVKKCWHVQEVAASLLSTKPGHFEPHLHKYVYREGEFISTFRTVSANDQIYIFNSLSHERTDVVELVTRYSNIRIVDHNKKEVTVQVNPIWKYSSDNQIKISRRFFKITFAVVVPPMTLELFIIKDTYDVTHSASTIFCSSCVVDDAATSDSIFPFNIQPIQTGDIQLESYKHRLIFDELTGFLKTVIEKETNIEKSVVIDFGAFKDGSVNSGMFLFNTNVSKPLYDVLMPYRTGSLAKATMIISGQITTELSSVYGRLLQQTIKIFNFIQDPLANAIYVENKVDYEVSPKNRELELFMSIQTDISNGNPPVIVTDNNGFQHTPRILNMSRRIESNMYPTTSMVYLQDRRSRLTYITDHSQGVTALQEGQLIVMLDRRVLYNDGRGAGEGLADSSTTCHRQFILLENFIEQSEIPADVGRQPDLKLPSLSAVYLANSLNYNLDIFVVDKNKTEHCYYAFFPLIKTSFPCDVSVINYRAILSKGGFQYHNPSAALLILQRRSISCQTAVSLKMQCNGESDFSLEKILRNLRAVYQTNLAGTNKGIPLLNFSPVNFPPMELMTLRVYF